MEQLHGRIVHVAERRHDRLKPVLLRKFRRRARRKLIVDGLVRIKGRDLHLVVVPLLAALFGPQERLVHQPPEKRLVAVHQAGQLPEGGQDQVFLQLLDLPEGCDIPAHGIVAHEGDAVVGAAGAVVEILPAAQIGAPVGEKIRILPLHPLPHGLPLRCGIVQGDLRLYLLPAGSGVQHMAAPVESEFAVPHLPTPFRYPLFAFSSVSSASS